MILKLSEPRLLAESINILSEIVTEVKARVDNDGLSIIAFDPANVALAMLKIPKDVFSEFDIKAEQLLGLNLDDLKQVLRRISPNSSLIIQKDDKDNTLHLSIQEKEKSKARRSFALALISLEGEEKKVQELKFASTVELPSDVFSAAISDAAIVSDACSFITTPDSFIIESKGSLNRSKAEFTEEEAKLKSVNAKARYSLEYLQKFAKASKTAPNVAIHFSNDYPLRLDFKDKIELSFILAPRVEEE